MSKNINTSMVYKVDWLSFTVRPKNWPDCESLINSILDYLDYEISDFENISGRYFYNTGLTIGNYFSIYYDDENKDLHKYSAKNVMFTFTGQGSTDLVEHLSRVYKSQNWEFVWLKFFTYLQKLNASVTRIDIALDDYYGILSFDQMERKLKRGEYRSSKRRYNVVKQLDTAGNIKGRSIYVGQSRVKQSKQGSYFVRFYDKFAEYKDKHAVMPKEVEDVTTGGGTGVWQRYEIQFNRGKAQNFVDAILDSGTIPEIYRGVMKNIIEFLVKPKKHIDKSLWKTCDWWEHFLAGAEKATLTDPERDLDLGRLLRWIRVSVVPSLHLLADIGKEKDFDVYQLIRSCQIDEYQKKQKRLLNNSLRTPKKVIKLYLKEFLEGYKND